MIIETAVRRPVAILMLFVGMMLIGYEARQRLPVDLLPSINYPNLTVITNYSDTPADDLTRLVTQPLEEVITGLAGVRRVVSKTREGVSTITVQYEWGTEMDFANLHLREAIDRVAYREDFPEAADRPLILRWDPASRPIAILVLRGDDPHGTHDRVRPRGGQTCPRADPRRQPGRGHRRRRARDPGAARTSPSSACTA